MTPTELLAKIDALKAACPYEPWRTDVEQLLFSEELRAALELSEQAEIVLRRTKEVVAEAADGPQIITDGPMCAYCGRTTLTDIDENSVTRQNIEIKDKTISKLREANRLLVAELERWRGIESSIPCCRCNGPVVEFTIANEIWNHIVRGDGKETDKEYLCVGCFAKIAQNRLEAAEEGLKQMRSHYDNAVNAQDELLAKAESWRWAIIGCCLVPDNVDLSTPEACQKVVVDEIEKRIGKSVEQDAEIERLRDALTFIWNDCANSNGETDNSRLWRYKYLAKDALAAQPAPKEIKATNMHDALIEGLENMGCEIVDTTPEPKLQNPGHERF